MPTTDSDSTVAPTPAARSDIPTGYAIVPHAVARDASLSVGARLLYVLIDGHLGAKATQKVSMPTLAAEMGTSVRTVQRHLAELLEAGLVSTITSGRSQIFRRVNPSRRDIRVGSATTLVSHPKRSNKGEVTTTTAAHQIPQPQPPAQSATAAEYLREINRATSAGIASNRTVKAHLAAIAEQGLTPADVAAIVDAELTAHQSTIENPARYVVGCILPSIAAGSAPSPASARPLTYLETVSDNPCQHGDPRGENFCALCRHATVGSAV